MGDIIQIGDAKVAVDLLKPGKMNVFQATEVSIYPNGWVKLVDEDGVTQHYPSERVGSIQER